MPLTQMVLAMTGAMAPRRGDLTLCPRLIDIDAMKTLLAVLHVRSSRIRVSQRLRGHALRS